MATGQQRKRIARARTGETTISQSAAENVRDEIRRSRNEWRAMQGLPAIDFTKKETNDGNG